MGIFDAIKSRLRAKIIFIFFWMVLAYALGSYAIQKWILLPSYVALENAEAEKDLARCRGDLEREIHHLAAFTLDWANWDDTWNFVKTKSPDYISANLVDVTFKNNRLDLLYIFNAAGDVVWGRHVDHRTLKDIPLGDTGPLFRAAMKNSDSSSPTRGARGVWMTESGPMLIAVLPILKSDESGPVNGIFAMGRLLDAEAVKAISDRTRVDCRVYRFADLSAEGLLPATRDALKKDPKRALLIQGEFFNRVYSTKSDIFGTPALVLEALVPREISKKGALAATWALVTALSYGVLVLVALGLLFQFFIIAPVTSLTHHAVRVRRENALSDRLRVARDDEIGVLSREFDAMLEQLEAVQEGLEHRVKERTADLNQVNQRLLEEVMERKETARKLLRAKNDLEAANRAKSDFLALISHELRTPLNGVLGITDLLLDEELDSYQRESVEIIKTSGERLLTIINELLEFSNIESGRIELRETVFSVAELVQRALGAFKRVAGSKGIALKLDIAPGTPARVFCDQGKLRQILFNLLGNAVKFTDSGHVELAVSAMPRDADLTVLRFDVRDTGIGVPPDKMEMIFEAFSKGANTSNRLFDGAGLGLTISARLTETLGGTIGFESEPEAGSHFFFTVKARPAKGDPTPPPPAATI